MNLIKTTCLLFVLFSIHTASANCARAYELYENERFQESFEWMMPCAEQGDAIAQQRLASLYEHGFTDSGAPDEDKAFKWVQLAANQGNVKASYNLGVYYETGIGVESDATKALEWYQLAAGKKHLKALLRVAYMYDEVDGTVNKKEAIKWYEKTYEQARELKKTPDSAWVVYEGDEDEQARSAAHNLSVIYYFGEMGVKDYSKAFQWASIAAHMGHSASQVNLGTMYSNGEGVKQDYTLANKWYLRVAEQGDSSAQFNLGLHYYYGHGFKKDLQKASAWLKKAAEQGHDGAIQLLREM